MATLAAILGEDVANRVFRDGLKRARAMHKDSGDDETMLIRLVAEHAVEKTALLHLIDELTQRVEALEARGPGCEWKGVYNDQLLLQSGDLVTFDGCLWLVRAVCTGVRPGTSKDHYVMVTKSRGR